MSMRIGETWPFFVERIPRSCKTRFRGKIGRSIPALNGGNGPNGSDMRPFGQSITGYAQLPRLGKLRFALRRGEFGDTIARRAGGMARFGKRLEYPAEPREVRRLGERPERIQEGAAGLVIECFAAGCSDEARLDGGLDRRN